jgi:hypothetical protein
MLIISLVLSAVMSERGFVVMISVVVMISELQVALSHKLHTVTHQRCAICLYNIACDIGGGTVTARIGMRLGEVSPGELSGAAQRSADT